MFPQSKVDRHIECFSGPSPHFNLGKSPRPEKCIEMRGVSMNNNLRVVEMQRDDRNITKHKTQYHPPMNTHKYIWSLASILLLFFFTSCETDDVEPDPNANQALVTLSAAPTVISENNGASVITATLSQAAAQEVVVTLAFAGTAIGDGFDFTVSSETISIAPGDLSGNLTLTAVQDTSEEGNETVEVSIAAVTGAVSDGPQSVTITIEDDDVPFEAQIILNEILYDPSNNGLDGDANGDGVYAQNEDEFLEFINLSSQPADMSGYKIFDSQALDENSPRHTVPANTIIPPGGVLVVFGGGTPTGTFGGATVQTSTTGDMNLNNAGDIVTLTDADGNVVISFDIEPLSNNPNEAYTRDPDITGDFVQHGSLNDLLFSPGTKNDGTPF
jgi:hypothetical protein